MLRNRAKRKYGTVAQEIQFSEFYRTAIFEKKTGEKGKRVIPILDQTGITRFRKIGKLQGSHPHFRLAGNPSFGPKERSPASPRPGTM